MDKIMEFLPFLIPLAIVQFILLGYTLYHILTHKNYKRGNRTLWLAVYVLLRYKYLRKPSNYPQNRNFPEKSAKK